MRLGMRLPMQYEYRALLVVMLLTLTPWLLFAQVKPDTSKAAKQEKAEEERLRRDLAIHNLLISVGALPIEPRADVVLGLLDAPIISDHQRQKEILEELFREAEHAKEPVKMRQLQGNVDTRPGYRSKAFEHRLDTLSIKLRVIRKMLALDKLRAREMFRSITPLKLEPLTCKEDLGYDMGEYYSVLRSIVEKTFDAEAKRRREPAFFAASIIREIDSSAQIGPAIDFLTQVNIGPADFGMLVDAFNAAVARIGGDPRSFATALKFDNVTDKISLVLLPKLRDAGHQRVETVKAYRTFVTKNLSATQCSDSLLVGTEEAPHPLIHRVNLFVEPPIDAEGSKPERTDPPADVYVYWRRPKSAQLLADLKRLRFGEAGAELGLDNRSDQTWQEKLLKYLELLDAWKVEDEETPEDHLHQKSVIYNSLSSLVPPGLMRSDVLMRYSLLLRDSPMRKENPAQWLHYVKMLIAKGKQLPAEQQPAFLDRLRQSGCEVCGLYNDLEKLKAFAGKNLLYINETRRLFFPEDFLCGYRVHSARPVSIKASLCLLGPNLVDTDLFLRLQFRLE